MAHRFEHSIELQALLLQYVLAPRRPFCIVPVLTGSFDEFLQTIRYTVLFRDVAFGHGGDEFVMERKHLLEG